MMKLFLFMAALILNDVANSLDYGEKPSSRISGPNAAEAKPHSKPWIVNLGGCGGTLIGRRFVLTAYHCSANGGVWEGKEIVLGDHDQTIREPEEQRVKVKKIVPYKIHGIADKRKADYEILVLEREVELNEYVQIPNPPKPGSECPEELEVCGWGRDVFNKTRKLDKLMCIDQTCRPSEKCPNKNQLPEYKRCASYPSKPPNNWLNSACGGDSGGPLFHTDKNGLTTIYGVVSGPGIFGNEFYCNGPTIYASVSHPRVLQWIKDTMTNY